MDSKNILSFLGLALRGGRAVVGEEPVESVVRARDARVLLLADDASDHTRRRCVHFADVGQCLWLKLPFTKDELGQSLGRSSVALVAVTDIGFAAALVHKLADLDSARYGEAAARLDLKAQRAAERRAEQKAHEKNVRTGKYKAKKEATQPETEKSAKKAEEFKPSVAERRAAPRKSRPSKENRPKPRAKANPYAHSRPVKKGKGSFRKKEG